MIDFVLTVLISALMGLGVGGGGLYISYLTLWRGIDTSLARGTNLIFFVISSAAALAMHLRKRKIFPLQLAVIVLFGSLGSLIFANLGNYINPEIPKKVLGSVLILSGGVSIWSVFSHSNEK